MHNGSDNIHCESSHSAKWGVSVYSILFFYQGWLFLQSLLLHDFIYLLIHTCMTKHFPSRISISISCLITTVSQCQRFFPFDKDDDNNDDNWWQFNTQTTLTIGCQIVLFLCTAQNIWFWENWGILWWLYMCVCACVWVWYCFEM